MFVLSKPNGIACDAVLPLWSDKWHQLTLEKTMINKYDLWLKINGIFFVLNAYSAQPTYIWGRSWNYAITSNSQWSYRVKKSHFHKIEKIVAQISSPYNRTSSCTGQIEPKEIWTRSVWRRANSWFSRKYRPAAQHKAADRIPRNPVNYLLDS